MKYWLSAFILGLLLSHITIEFSLFKISDNQLQTNATVKATKETKDQDNTKKCPDNCAECVNEKCKKCIKGYYTYEGSCVQTCPEQNLLADNYSLSCKPASSNPVFIKAYTFSRCLNKCGSTFKDCSCEPSCKQKGTCCSDYNYCDYVNGSAKLNTQCPLENCGSCSSDQALCLMCKQGFMYYDNHCVTQCPQNTYSISSNSMCIKRPHIEVDNCEQAENGKCTKCLHGLFLYENECSSSCPDGTRANRINFTCVNKSTFAFFMIFPSLNSCKAKCGVDYTTSNADCSCHHNCLKNGNCCDDFDSECKEEIKLEKCKACNECVEGKCTSCQDNSDLVQGDCNCKEGFYYSILKDKCEEIEPSQRKEVIALKEREKESYLRKTLRKDFSHNYPNEETHLLHNVEHLSGNVVFNGNVSMNVYADNDNPSIVNENILNLNSFNNDTTIEKNINSRNVIMKIGNHFHTITSSEPPAHVNDNNELLHPTLEEKSQCNDNENENEETSNKNTTAQHRTNKIFINKHFHLDHTKKFPNNLFHSNVTEKKKKEAKGKDDDNDTTKKSQKGTKEEDHSDHKEVHKMIHNKLKDKIHEKCSDIDKKIKVHIHLPVSKEKDESELDSKHKITVYNHYFINDKSMTMHKPKNPNVFNFYDGNCKGGKCLKKAQFGNFANPKFISDKDFQGKEDKKEITLEENGVLVTDRSDQEDFVLPKKEKSHLLNDFTIGR